MMKLMSTHMLAEQITILMKPCFYSTYHFIFPPRAPAANTIDPATLLAKVPNIVQKPYKAPSDSPPPPPRQATPS